MTALNLSEERITHRQQIVQLLRMAIDQRWRFSYVIMVRNHVETRPVVPVSVNQGEGTFSVDRQIERADANSQEAIMFRAQSGGISVIFKARVAEATAAAAGNVQIELPYEVRCTQLRRSTRIDVKTLAGDVPAVLYLAMGFELEGLLLDISTSGAQFQVAGDETGRFKNLQMLEACKISLPDDFVLRTGVQLMGLHYNKMDDVTVLRCQLVDMEMADEEKLDSYINKVLEQADSSVVVISSQV
ncbi:MAG: PilZ domain-containing protein [Pseudomonadales bacterium]|nr:PilZ domain-containing protein [Pseudomonadales bacterium]